MNVLQRYLIAELVLFVSAVLMHTGVLTSGWEHRHAATAETVISIVLAVGVLVSVAVPTGTRRAALVAQGFALLGTCVGLLTIAIGVGPRTAFDLGLHAAMIAVLVMGLSAAVRGAG
jgi:hypothetical protein